MKKKRLLFVIDSLVAAGAERSLVTLLSMLDYEKYEVDLQLFGYGGEFEQFLPKEVNLLPPLPYNLFLRKTVWGQLKTFNFKRIFSHFESTTRLKVGKHINRQIAQILWDSTKRCYSPTSQYDVAIAYAQGFPTFYVAETVCAKKKLSWVNADLTLTGKDKKFQVKRYNKIDTIVAVSESSLESFLVGCPEFKDKTEVIYDIIDPDHIRMLSNKETSFKLKKDVPYLITVSRLCNKSKGMDIALDVCRILKERGVNFRWYVFGLGDFKTSMQQYIVDHDLSDLMKLMGRVSNPMPYLKDASIYVCTSRKESFGLSVAEARILNIPVVTTEFTGVYNQMIPEKNGIVVPIDAKAVADAIEDLLNHPEKRSKISEFQRTEKKGNSEELQKFYSLIND